MSKRSWAPLLSAMIWMVPVGLTTLLGGCDALGYMLYQIAPPEKMQKVPAEFDGLAGRSMAIVIYIDQGVQYEYPYARLGLSSVLAAELKNHIENLTVVDPRRVIAYQAENIRWDMRDKTELGRDLGADYVLLVALDEYTMRERGSVNLYRGRIRGHASLYETARPEDQARLWDGDDFAVVYPEHAPTGELGEDDSKIRYATEKRFAQLVAKKFYIHEVPINP
ncbi:MAG: hypothetical protein ACYSTL_05120 [Planctomycetota bacterium]|jgi:hypothetical protein